MRKARMKSVKVLCVLLAAVLMFGFNMSAMTANLDNEAAYYLEELVFTEIDDAHADYGREVVTFVSPNFSDNNLLESADYEVYTFASPNFSGDDLSASADYEVFTLVSPNFSDSDLPASADYEVFTLVSPNFSDSDLLANTGYQVFTETWVSEELDQVNTYLYDDLELIAPASTTLIISPATNWTNIPAAGGAQRTIAVTTSAPTYDVHWPGWLIANPVPGGFRLTATANPIASVRTGTVYVIAGNQTRSFTVSQLAAATTLTISPPENWINIPAAGGAQRAITVTTNAPTYEISIPPWLNHEWTTNGFRLTATPNPIASVRTGTVTVTAGTQTHSFSVSQLAAVTILTIAPPDNWTNIPAAGGAQRTITVTSNAPTYGVHVPEWLTFQELANGFRLTATQNTIASVRTGTVTVVAGNQARSFDVSQLAAATTLTILPTTDWINIPAAGDVQRTTIVTTNAPEYRVYRSPWLTLEELANGFRLTATPNPIASVRTGTVIVVAGNQTRSFNVSQLAAAATLTITPATNWTNIPAAGGAQRTITVTTNALEYRVYRPSWLEIEQVPVGFRLTATQNTTTSVRTDTVDVIAGNQTRSFTVSQLAAAGANQVTITFDLNGGVGNPIVIPRRVGEMLGTLPTVTRPGETFAGWYTAPTGGERINERTLVPNHNVTYFARWMIWHSSYNRIGFWPGTINLYARTVGTPSNDFHFLSWTHIASNTWAYALGISIGSTTIEPSAQIQAYGGTRADIREILHESHPDYIGWAWPATENPAGTITVGGITRNVYRFSGHIRMIVIDISRALEWSHTNQRDIMLSTTMHEFGHALGYLGHSPNANDIMWNGTHTGTTLQPNEIRHLHQIYNRFR